MGDPSSRLCVENAENSARNAAALDATNRDAVDLLEEILGSGGEGGGSGEGAHERKPKEFVAELFDSFASTFDEKLASLEYRVPALVGAASEALMRNPPNSGDPPSFSSTSPPSFRSALDAGCGTGLAGRYLRPLVSGPMVGVDASRKMLDIAAECTVLEGCGLSGGKNEGDVGPSGEGKEPLYDGLFAMDLEEMSLENTLRVPGLTRGGAASAAAEGFDLVVAADVLVYFGRLEPILAAFASVSSPGAGLIFSCERASDDEAPLGWRLKGSGRFAHTRSHAVGAAAGAGYDLISYEEIVPRMERGEEVRGHLFSFLLVGEGGSGSGGNNNLKEEL